MKIFFTRIILLGLIFTGISSFSFAQLIENQPENDTICIGDDASFTVQVFDLSDTTYQWQYKTSGGTNWNDLTEGLGGNCSICSGTNDSTLVLSGPMGNYLDFFYRCVVTEDGTEENSDSAVIVPEITASFSYSGECQGSEVDFSDQSLALIGEIDQWAWTFDDGTTSSLPNPVHAYSDAGMYDVKLIVTSSLGCTDSTEQTITIYPKPEADFTFNEDCLGIETAFFDESSIDPPGSIESWDWDFDDGETSNEQDPSHQYENPGSYNVQLIVTSNNDCKDTIVKTVNVFELPQAAFSYEEVCFGNYTQFTDESTINSGSIAFWQWNFDDGQSSSEQDPQHLFSESGQYDVMLIVTSDHGCLDSITHTINVFAKPQADFTFDDVCQNNPVIFTDASTIGSGNIVEWEWDFGDDLTSNEQNPEHLYTEPDTYNVQLIVTSDHDCKDTISQEVAVFYEPVAAFSFNEVCFGNTTEFSDESTISNGNIASWDWDFGDGNSSSSQNPDHTYENPGQYNVKLIVTSNNSCIDSVDHIVMVYPLPVADFSFVNACFGVNTEFTDQSTINQGNIVSWEWNFGDNATSDEQDPVHMYSSTGSFNVRLIVLSDHGCADTVYHDVEVYELPSAGFDSNEPCLGMPTEFTDNSSIPSGSIDSWNWDFGDESGTSELQNPSYTYGEPGTFQARLIVTSNVGCNDTITKEVTVNPLPAAYFTSTEECLGIPTTFIDGSSISSGNISIWNWDFGDGTDTIYSQFSQSVSHTYGEDGDYSVSLSLVSGDGCMDEYVESPVHVQAISYVTNQLSGSDTICSLKTITINAQPENAGENPEFNWFIDNEPLNIDGDFLETDTLTVDHAITCKVMPVDLACPDITNNSSEKTVFVKPSPMLKNSGELIPKPLTNPVVLICVDSSINYSYAWYEGENKIASAGEQFYYPKEFGKSFKSGMDYHVEVTNEYKCTTAGKSYTYTFNKSALFSGREIFTIYPNPASDYLMLIVNEDIVTDKDISINYVISDLTGMLILKSEVIGFEKMIDISKLPKGIYLIEVSVAGYEQQAKKIIIN